MLEILEILLKVQMSEKFGHILVMFSKQYFYELHIYFVYPLLFTISHYRTCYNSVVLVRLINTHYNELDYMNRLPFYSIYSLPVRFNCGLLKTLR